MKDLVLNPISCPKYYAFVLNPILLKDLVLPDGQRREPGDPDPGHQQGTGRLQRPAGGSAAGQRGLRQRQHRLLRHQHYVLATLAQVSKNFLDVEHLFKRPLPSLLMFLCTSYM